MTPDATCNYVYAGEYNGRAYLRRLDGAWFIWWDYSTEYWIISPIKGDKTPPIWSRPEPITGTYFPTPPANGIATVTKGEH